MNAVLAWVTGPDLQGVLDVFEEWLRLVDEIQGSFTLDVLRNLNEVTTDLQTSLNYLFEGTAPSFV